MRLKKRMMFANENTTNNRKKEDNDVYKNQMDKYDEEYKNSKGFITPYHILFNDYIDEIISMNYEEAILFCINTIDKLNEKNESNTQYMKPTQEEYDSFVNKINNAKDSLDIVYLLKHIVKEDY